jgi:hypothetical protein
MRSIQEASPATGQTLFIAMLESEISVRNLLATIPPLGSAVCLAVFANRDPEGTIEHASKLFF